jgi:formylglycine-generating enzyme required for sulfatase activity
MNEQHELEQLFYAAKHQPPLYSLENAQHAFLANLPTTTGEVSPNNKSFFSLKIWIIMLTIASTIVLTIFIHSSNENTVNAPITVSQKSKDAPVKKMELLSSETQFFSNNIRENMLYVPPFFEEFTDTSTKDMEFSPVFSNYSANLHVNGANKLEQMEEVYLIPKLTEEEIKKNNKQKKAMLKALEKSSKKSYALVPSSKFEYQGKMTSVQAFLIQKTEVSNLEYRTCLFDLLIQGREDDFLKARPDHKQWSLLTKQGENLLEDLYFSHPAYDNYPVVNISREGAEIYCKWLTQEVYKVLDDKKKTQFSNLRLPVREEWVLAASADGKHGPYAWTGAFTRNSSGCFLANYQPMIDSDSSSYQADGGLFTVRVDSYFPNDFGLYNMNGNVAEMVYNDIKTKAAGTAGGAWNSTDEEIKILGPDPYAGVTTANPAIGFRVVMTVK